MLNKSGSAETTPVPDLPHWIAMQLPRGVRRRFVETGEHRVPVMEWGPADGHAVVLLHGNPMWGFLWRKACPRCSSGRAASACA
jgi:hypothetical protein